MFAVPKLIQEKLDAFGATYRFFHVAQNHVEPPNQPDPPQVKCEIVENSTGKIWATAISGDKTKPGTEEEALQLAVNAINPSNKPLTPAEVAAKNAQLASENAELKKELEELRARRKSEK